MMVKLPVLKIWRTDIKQSEFQRLRDRVWLNDNLIYCFLKNYVQDMIHILKTNFVPNIAFATKTKVIVFLLFRKSCLKDNEKNTEQILKIDY